MAKTIEALCSPKKFKEFYKTYWGKGPVSYKNRKFIARYQFTSAEIWEAIENNFIPANTIRFIKNNGDEQDVENFISEENGLLDAGAIKSFFFKEKGSLALNHLQIFFPKMKELADTLSQEIGFSININAYHTPPRAKALEKHWDLANIFVLQMEGQKEWQVFPPIVENPIEGYHEFYRFKPFKLKRALYSEIIKKGDVLYLPVGFPHQAKTVDVSSLHLAISLQIPSLHEELSVWMDDLVAESAMDVESRQSILTLSESEFSKGLFQKHFSVYSNLFENKIRKKRKKANVVISGKSSKRNVLVKQKNSLQQRWQETVEGQKSLRHHLKSFDKDKESFKSCPFHKIETLNFLSQFWEREPYLVKSKINVGDVFGFDKNKLFQNIGLKRYPANYLRVVDHKKNDVDLSGFLEEDSRYDLIDPDKVFSFIKSNRGSLVVRHLENFNSSVMSVVKRLESLFEAFVFANAYYTPVRSQTFRWHWDVQDVIVLQISGEKEWNVYHPIIELPHRDFQEMKNFKGELSKLKRKGRQTYRLTPGDFLYIPRGFIHEAKTIQQHDSLHVSFGIETTTILDLLEVAKNQILDEAANIPSLRQRVPMKNISQRHDIQETDFSEVMCLLADLIKKSDPNEVFSAFNGDAS